MIRFVSRWGSLILFAGMAILAWIVLRKKAPLKSIEAEMRAVRAEAKAEKLEAKHGLDAAIKAIEEEHDEQIKTLDEEQKKQAEELRGNPRKLARFLANAG